MPTTVITRAHGIEAVANPIIDQFHKHLAGARILFLFTTQERKHLTKTVLATAQKLSAIQRYLSSGDEASSDEGYDFLILVGTTEWQLLTPVQRIALIDHELCHCWLNEKGEWTLRAHDVEEFAEILERHGSWKQDVRNFVAVAQQLRLVDGARVPAAVA